MKLHLLSIVGIIATLALITEGRPTEDMTDFKANCFIQRLKKNNKLEADYHEYPVETLPENCEFIIDATTKSLFKSLAIELRKDAFTNDFTPCLMADIRTAVWVDNILLSFVYEYDTTMAQNVKEKKIEELDKKISRAAEISFLACYLEEEFGELFDEYSKEPSTTDEELIADYCDRKYVVDHNLLPTYEIVLNPKHVNVDGVDCDALVNAKLDYMKEVFVKKISEDELEFNELQIKCANKKYREGKFGDKFMIAKVSTTIGLNEEQLALERKRFTKLLAVVFTDLDVCDH